MQLGATVILARLLTPDDYGLNALVGIVVGLAAIVIDGGIPGSVISAKSLDSDFLSTAFWLNLGIGLASAMVTCLLAGSIARFFDEPGLEGLLYMASGFFILSTNAVHVAILQRALRFRPIANMTLVNSAAGIASSLVGAALGMGAYSLVLALLVERLAYTIQTWYRVPWAPELRFSRVAALEIWRFGSGLTGNNLLGYMVASLDRLLIGRYVSVADVGHYNRATNLMLMPIQQTTRTLVTVFFPALAAISNDQDRFHRAWLRLVRSAWIVGLPAGVALSLMAPEIVYVVYGDQWDAVAPILAILSLGVPFLVLSASSEPAYQALGRTRLQFHLGAIAAVIAVLSLALGIRWATLGIAVAVVLRTTVTALINILVILPIAGTTLRRLLGALWRACVAALAMVAVVVFIDIAAADLAPPLLLLSKGSSAVVSYGAAIWLLERQTIMELAGRAGSRAGTGKGAK